MEKNEKNRIFDFNGNVRCACSCQLFLCLLIWENIATAELCDAHIWEPCPLCIHRWSGTHQSRPEDFIKSWAQQNGNSEMLPTARCMSLHVLLCWYLLYLYYVEGVSYCLDSTSESFHRHCGYKVALVGFTCDPHDFSPNSALWVSRFGLLVAMVVLFVLHLWIWNLPAFTNWELGQLGFSQFWIKGASIFWRSS